MPLNFATFFRRVSDATDIATQQDLAVALGVNRSAITQAKRRDSIPQKWILSLIRSHGLAADWLEFGRGVMLEAQNRDTASENPAVIVVPKVQARLCAGGGSWEVEAAPIDEHVFKEEWLARKGSPGSMVLMDVFGNSMEPEIREGDMVLVDQARLDIQPGAIYAVGYEDTVMVKRLERTPQGVSLHSDNPDYSPITIVGDELHSFRIIGKIVWISREYR